MPPTPEVLVLAPMGRDAQIAVSILSTNEISSRICANLQEVPPLLESAQCLVIAEEALISADRKHFAAWFENQPAWSDFPIVLLTKRGNEFGSVTGRPRRCGWLDLPALKRSLQLNGVDGMCVTKLDVLERPFLASSLANSVRSALRARARQLEVKSYIEQKDEVARRQRLLIRELHHRVKNTLANVTAMMGATARSSGSIDDFVREFSARIVSLADTHSMLTDDYWQMA